MDDDLQRRLMLLGLLAFGIGLGLGALLIWNGLAF